MRDILVEIWESVRRNKLRTTLTGLAVSWGIFMLIVLLSAGNGVMNTTMSNMSEMNTDAMRVYGGVTSKPYDGLEEGRRLDLTDKDVRLTGSKAFRDVIVDVCPTISTSSLTMTYGKKNFSVYTVGIYPIYTRINRTEILAGRSINDNDIAEARKVIVITHLQAKNMLMNSTDYEKIIGRRVKVGNLSYKIVGVRHGAENENDTDVFMPYTTLKGIFAKSDRVDNIIFTFKGLETDEDHEAFEARYRAAINGLHHADPEDRSAVWISNSFTRNKQMNSARNTLETALWVVGLLTLLGGIVGVSNIMLITVKERTHEFGIRKAIGASPLSIISLIVTESVAITALFGYIGMVLGMMASEVMDSTLGHSTVDIFGEHISIMKDPGVDLGTAVGVTVVLILAGTIAGLFPAWKAARVKPVEALSAN
ncbi:MAG: ABC transporter permease [Bacteroidales bacterium]|nr:ABC transporter permease [Bacteroidales bacterium]